MPDPSNTQFEQNKRRFDIGSGVPLELLDTRTLEFIFHAQVKGKLLGPYAGIPEHKGSKRVFWDENFGVGKKGNTDEVIVLCTDGSNKRSMYKIFQEYGSIDSILGTDTVSSLTSYTPSHEWGVAIIQDILNRIGPKIFIATALEYKDTATFVNDHVFKNFLPAKKRMISQLTPKAGQNKVLVTSFFTGSEHSNLPGNHPDAIDIEDLNLIVDTNFDNDSYPEARRSLMLFGR
jgi:hypothetical protein